MATEARFRSTWRAARHRSLIAAVSAILLALAIAHSTLARDAVAEPGGRPNVILLVTDDQTLEEMRGLPLTSWLVGANGTTFTRAYVSFPLCCPARASMLSGQYMHNHGVRGNNGAFGGWARFAGLGTEARSVASWLRDAGYYNVQIGKYMNGYVGSPPPIPPGWDEWYGKVSEYDAGVHGGRIYFNYSMREDPPVTGGVPCPSGKPKVPGEPFTCLYGQSSSDYQTDVIRRKAVEAIHRLSDPLDPQQPFFLNVEFNAPHSPYDPAPGVAWSGTPIANPPGTNEKNMKDKPRFLRRLPKLGYGKLAQIAERRRRRLAMLLSVDQAVASIVQALDQEGQLDNTYLIFTSDNAYFSGEHRIRQGKYLPHEPSSHVPLLIRGPGIPSGGSSETLVSNVDIASTIAEIAGIPPALPQDGRSLLPYARQPGLASSRALLLEADTGPSIDDEGVEGPQADDPALRKFRKNLKRKKKQLRRKCRGLAKKRTKTVKLVLRCYRRGVKNIDQEPVDRFYKLRAPAYRAIRTDRYAMFLYSTGELELYDMWRDPHQLSSVAKSRRYRGVRSWLLAALNGLAVCSGPGCTVELGPDPVPAKKRKRCGSKRKARSAKRKCAKGRQRR